MTSAAEQPRPLIAGLKALAGARSALPATTTAALADGPLEYVRAGAGAPAIVLLSAIVPVDGWALVLPQLAQDGTVLAYNARGVGDSAAPRRPQTGEVVVDTLRELLAAAAIAPPYVLVGHTLGGLHANLFARRFPHEVAGVVLLEATHPDDDVHERLLRFLPRVAVPKPRGARRFDAIHQGAETAAQIAQAGPFPDVPLTVVSGSRAPRRWTTSPEQVRRHAARQLELVELSALGTHAVAPASGPFPQVTDPDVVIRAVSKLAAAARERRGRC